MNILRAERTSVRRRGTFQDRNVRPGLIDGPASDNALGPLSMVGHVYLGKGTMVSMHEHRNDEILSYMWKGSMLHEDSAGHRIEISANKLMMMNAGESFWHEESTPGGPVEMLQIMIRPREADLPADVDFFDRRNGAALNGWTFIAGPEGSEAPLTVRNAVHVYDIRIEEGRKIDTPAIPDLTSWLYVVDGSIEIDGERLDKGDAASDGSRALPPILARTEATLVLFLVDTAAPASRAGTISGH